jgi:hypothetical protein
MLYVWYLPFQLLKHLTDFRENWYERYAVCDHPNLLLLKIVTNCMFCISGIDTSNSVTLELVEN